MTLEEIICKERKNRHEGGIFGVKACKESVLNDEKIHNNITLDELLNCYVKRANDDIFFNKTMVLACYELISERKSVSN